MDWIAVGARIRKQRELLGYTREDFAEKLDITPKFCSDIELGVKGMSIKTLCKIADVLRISTDYILFGTTVPEVTPISSMMLQWCTPLERKYAEDILKTFIMAMQDKQNQ